jgi:hypothetical protein
VVLEVGARRVDPGEVHGRVGVQQVVDHLQRVLALFLGLLVEERGELRVGLARVVGADGGVLMGCRELAGDLGIKGVDEALGRHGCAQYNAKTHLSRVLGGSILTLGDPG